MHNGVYLAQANGSATEYGNTSPKNELPTLSDLADVNLSSLSDGQVLTFENGEWKNKTPNHGVTVVAIPTVVVDTYTYDGTEQGPTITNLDSDFITVTDAKKTNAGTYTLTLALKNTNTQMWTDLTTANKTYSYTINKANQTVTASTNSVALTPSQTYVDVTITKSGEGTFSVTSSDTGVATVAHTSGDTYRITGISSGSATITASLSATENYNVASATISVSATIIKIVTWANGTDAEIVAMVEAADNGYINLSDYWSVGDERVVNLSAMPATGVGESQVAQTATFVLMHAGLYDLTSAVSSGRTKCSFVVGMKNCLIERGYINTSTSNMVWKNSQRRTWCNNVFKNAIPSTLSSIFKQFKAVYASTNDGSTNEVTDDYFTLPAAKEVLGGTATSAGAETWDSNLAEFNALTQFTYYETTANRIKRLGDDGTKMLWWTRSCKYNASRSFVDIGSSGSYGSLECEFAFGISPFGCI